MIRCELSQGWGWLTTSHILLCFLEQEITGGTRGGAEFENNLLFLTYSTASPKTRVCVQAHTYPEWLNMCVHTHIPEKLSMCANRHTHTPWVVGKNSDNYKLLKCFLCLLRGKIGGGDYLQIWHASWICLYGEYYPSCVDVENQWCWSIPLPTSCFQTFPPSTIQLKAHPSVKSCLI